MNARQSFGAAILAAALITAAAGPALTPAWAQANLDAGKSPAKIFAQGCGSCHATPHELHDIRRDFLVQHYTTGPEQAALIADYLEAMRSEPRPIKPRRGPRAEIELADVVITGSIGVAAPAAAPSETAPSETAPPQAATREDAFAETVTPEAATPPTPLDVGE
jgi:hypothetical protein